jgi:hypothetical protein
MPLFKNLGKYLAPSLQFRDIRIRAIRACECFLKTSGQTALIVLVYFAG